MESIDKAGRTSQNSIRDYPKAVRVKNEAHN